MLAAITIAAALLFLAGIVISVLGALKAPEGYEDSGGFHVGDSVQTRKDIPTSKMPLTVNASSARFSGRGARATHTSPAA